jgi:hypothetical protein
VGRAPLPDQQLEQVVIVLSSHLALGFETALGRALPRQQAESDVMQHGKVLRAIAPSVFLSIVPNRFYGCRVNWVAFFQVQVEGVDRATAHVSISLVRTLRVVVDQPGIEVRLELLHALVELGAKGDAEELVQDRAVEALHEAVGLRLANSGAPMLDVIQGQVQLIRMGLRAAEYAAGVPQDSRDGDLPLLIERQDVVVHESSHLLRSLGGMQKAKAVAAMGIYGSMKVDTAYALQRAHQEGILADQFARPAALHMPFP